MPTQRKPGRWCSGVTYGFLAIYLFTIGVFVVGQYGLFGNDKDPLAGIYLILLGMPWVRLSDHFSFSEYAGIWIAVACPLLNFLVIVGICRLLRR